MRRWSQALKKKHQLQISEPIPTFETSIGSTPRGSKAATVTPKKGKPVLDYYTNRDVVDEILYHLPFRDLLQWRATCRELNTKLDLSRLSLRIRPMTPDNKFCLMEVCTGGNILLGGWSCRYRPAGGILYTDTGRPKLRAVRGCKLLRQVDVLGRCPHHSPVPVQFIRELEQQKHKDARALERDRQFTTWGNILRVNLFPDTEGNYLVDDTEVKPGSVGFTVLCDNWRANPKCVPFRPTTNAKQAVIFIIDGREPGTTLLKTPMAYDGVSVVYDFSSWRKPARDLTGWSLDLDNTNTRMSNLVWHASRVLLAGGHIHLLGLHNVNSHWLDPHYPGDEHVPAPNHPNWFPLAVHVCSAILAQLTASGAGGFKDFVDHIHVVPQRVSLEEWADFIRPFRPNTAQFSYPHFHN